MSFKIRKANREDVPLILELIKELAEYEKLSHEVVATEALLEKPLFDDNRAEALIGEEDGKPQSFAIYFYNYSTFLGRPGLYLEDLFVRPECRGKGYGKAMLAHLAQIAVEQECGRFEWTVLDWNKPAKDFYESLGARHKTSWEIYCLKGEELKALASQAL